MALTEALFKLHAAGRIKSPWLPGMAVSRANATWPKVPLTGRVDDLLGFSVGRHSGTWRSMTVRAAEEWQPDLTDPATVGCLEALDCEARGEVLVLDHHVDHTAVPVRFNVWCPQTDREGPSAPTKGEAWAADLIALAEGS